LAASIGLIFQSCSGSPTTLSPADERTVSPAEGTQARRYPVEIALTRVLPEKAKTAISPSLMVSHIGQFDLIAD
jgi:hypothetical protein